MSGIAVLYQRDGAPADRSTVERMLAAVPYRGIDGSGIWTSGPIVIGHSRLATTPEAAAEASPFVDKTSGLVLTMDGRVDNRDELIAELNSRGHSVRTGTDAEIVLRAWQCWATDSFSRLIGDFAFALWDSSKQTLICVRDFLGVKPFYYFDGPGFFLCATEPHQLFQDPRVPRRANEAAIADRLARMPVERADTLFEGICRLEPSHYLSVSARGIERRKYYEPDSSREITYGRDEEYADHFLSLFKQVVRSHLRSNQGVASDLSGGLDSSSIVCVTEQLLRAGEVRLPAFETFSVGFESGAAAETNYVEAVLSKYPHRHTYLSPGMPPLSQLIAQVAHYLDLPDYPNAVCADYTPLLGERNDLRVRLTGFGGDEWLGPTYAAYADLLRHLSLITLARKMRSDRAPSNGFAPFPGYLKALAQFGVLPLVPQSFKTALRPRLRRPELPAIIAPAFAARTELLEQLSTRQPTPRTRTFAQHKLYKVYTSGWLPYSLEMDARWTAGFRMEGRNPFLDRRIFEFAYAIPSDQRFRPGVNKFVLRNSMRGILPERLRQRSDKADLTLLHPMAMIALGGERLFENLNLVKNGWIDGVVVLKLYRAMVEAFSRGDPS